jgi:hypothetical protein
MNQIIKIIDYSDGESRTEVFNPDEMTDEELAPYAKGGEMWAIVELGLRKEANKNNNSESD